MDSRSVREMSCVLCSRPVDLRLDLCADENGKAIHEGCYVKRITSAQDDRSTPVSQAFIEFLNTASAHWAAKACPDCGSRLEYRNCTFFFQGQT